MNYKNFISYFLIFFVSISSSNPIAFAGTVDALTLPTGGNVVTGSVSISQNNSGRMDVSQSSNQAIVNWDTFNVGSSASVHFNQPTSRSSILNNVLSGQSIINGSIFSNGQLILVNPTGILTGPTSAIRSEGAILSTLNLTNQNYLNKIFNFSASSNSNLLNEGKIEGEYIALLSPSITNKGTITTNVATSLAAGDDIRLSIGDTNLLTVSVNPSKIKSSINNEGNIKSQNGIVTLKTDIAQSVIDQVIKIENAKADGLISENGIVKLVANTGAITAKDIKIDAGSNGTSIISGILNSNSDTSNGGSVEVIAKEIDINAATISADGKTGGGKILIGGDWQGTGDLLQATYLDIDANSKITANALTSGAGGTIVAWSDIKNSNSFTRVSGTLEAKGIDGSGGQIETSGADLDINGIKIDTSSVTGRYGNWLVDPTDLTIDASAASTYASNLASSDVTLTADNTITLDSAISYSGVRDSTLTFNATNTVLNANVTSSNGTLSLDFNSIVEIGDANTTLTTNGGNVDISGVIRAVTAETNNFTINAGAGNVTFSSNVNSTPGSAETSSYLTSSTHTTTRDGNNPWTLSKDLGSDWTFEAKYYSANLENGGLSTIFSYGHYTEGILIRTPERSDSFYVRGQNQGSLNLFGVSSGSGTGGGYKTVKIVYNNNIAKIYVDGSLTSNGTNSRSSSTVINPSTKTIMIGKAHHAGSEGLTAIIKDIVIVTDASSPNSMINNLTVTANQFNAQAIELGGTLAVTNSGSSTISGVISGDTALTKAGSGSLALPSTNTYTGRTTINGGTINITKDAGLGAAPGSFVADQLIFNGGEIFNYNGASFSLNANRGITLTGDGTIRVNNSGLITVPGAITGSGSLTLRANNLLFNSRLKLTGTNTYTGDTIIQGGTIIVDGAGTLGNGSYAGNITIGSLYSGKFDYASSTDLIASGVISGQGILQASGNGVFEPTATNTYTGGTIIDGGKIAAKTDRNFGANPSSDDPDNILLKNAGTIYFGSINSSNSLGHVNFGYNNNRGIYLESGQHNFIAADGGSGTNKIYSIISGPGGVTYGKAATSSKSLGLYSANTYTGDTKFNYTSGSNNGVFIAADAWKYSTVYLNGTRTDVRKGWTALQGSINFGGLAGDATDWRWQNKQVTFGYNNQDTTFSGTVSRYNNDGYDLVKVGTGTTTFSNTSSGVNQDSVNGFDIQAGKIKLAGNWGLSNSSAGDIAIASGAVLEIDSSISNSFSGVLSGSGTLLLGGSGTQTFSGDNTFSGTINIADGGIKASHANSLGATPVVTSSSGRFETGSITLPSLRINGNVTLQSGITTTGSQYYNGNVIVKAGSVASPVEYTTTNSDVTFAGTLKGEGNAKARSLNIDAGTGNVLFGDRVGYAFNDEVVNINNTADSFYKLEVDANEITIKGDIMTYEEQIYNGDVLIGSTATNGTTRTFLSMDPKVEFNGTVNDTVKGKHTLIAKAIEIDRGANSIPVVNFNSTVGRSVALAGYNGLTGYQVINRNYGTINNSVPVGTKKGLGQTMSPVTSSSSSSNDRAKKAEKGANQVTKIFTNSFLDTFKNISFSGNRSMGFKKSVEIVYGNNPDFGKDINPNPRNNTQKFFNNFQGTRNNLTTIKSNKSSNNDFSNDNFYKAPRDIKELFLKESGGKIKASFLNPNISEENPDLGACEVDQTLNC
jgi:filamentous hemagglutinin family protein